MNCDRIAPYYRWFEFVAFGPYLERARLHWISSLADTKRVLILGDGDGRFLARYVSANPEAHIDSVDLSAKMLELAEQRLQKLPASERRRIRLIQDDALTTERLAGPYDLVVTNFFLDCLDANAQRELLEKLAPKVAKSARWLVTDFQVIEGSKTAGLFRLLTRIMYSFFRSTTGLRNRQLVDFSPRLEKFGFTTVEKQEWLFRFLSSAVWKR
jgi:SAM-dependent methyltransferase